MFDFSFLDLIELFLVTVKSFWVIAKSFWWLWAVVLGFKLVEIFFHWFGEWLDRRRIQKWLNEHRKIEEWKTIDHKKFEEITAIIFRNLGYKAEVTGRPGDRGIDIIARKGGKRTFIQCKRMDRVPPSAIREFYGSIRDRLKEGEKGVFVTTGEFSQEGKEYAKTRKEPIELIDGIELEKMANL